MEQLLYCTILEARFCHYHYPPGDWFQKIYRMLGLVETVQTTCHLHKEKQKQKQNKNMAIWQWQYISFLVYPDQGVLKRWFFTITTRTADRNFAKFLCHSVKQAAPNSSVYVFFLWLTTVDGWGPQFAFPQFAVNVDGERRIPAQKSTQLSLVGLPLMCPISIFWLFHWIYTVRASGI